MEILSVLDENGNVIGKEERKKVHDEGLWHIHVGIWIMNKKGELLFQQRVEEKKVNPLKWTRTGGHVDYDETPLLGIKREVKEEIGLDLAEENIELVEIEKRNAYSEEVGLYNRTFVYVYFAYSDIKLEDCVLQKEEVKDVKYITIEDMEKIYNEKDPNYTFTKWETIEPTIRFLKEKRDALNLK